MIMKVFSHKEQSVLAISCLAQLPIIFVYFKSWLFFSFVLLYWFHCTITFSYRDCLIMINTEYQHQCSSNAIAYNTSIFYKLRKSYLIIDIEPTVDKSQHPSDRSYSAIIKDYYDCECICLSTNIRHTLWKNHFSCYFGWLILEKRRRMTLNRVILFFFSSLYE
jgi:hypothetical protein